MQIGDQVRFLNEVGGGKVTGFQGKNIVLVEDQDGFDIPMLRSQVVVIETNANNFEVRKKGAPSAVATTTVRYLDDDVEDDPSARPISYQAPPQERKGGDMLNVCLAFVPENARELSTTPFCAYLVNDSNYFVSVAYANKESSDMHLRWQGTVEPNTKQLMETFERDILNDLENVAIQLIAWKQDKPYTIQPAVDVQLHIDTVKFFKLHAFRPSPFFREGALIYPLATSPVEETVAETAPLPSQFPEEAEPEEDASSSEWEEVETDYVPVRTREEERAALKAAKRQLKEEQRRQREKELLPTREDILEIDLHINALLDHTEGLSPSVLMNTQLTEFRIMMDRNMKKKGQHIVFIHGKGQDELRDLIIKELQRRYRTCTYEDASLQKYGYGALMVTIK